MTNRLPEILMPKELVNSKREDVLHTISKALMSCRFEPPKRRKSAWHVGFEDDTDQATRCALAIVEAMDAAGYHIFQNPPGPPPGLPPASRV